jgi:hypothetical protein
MANGHGIGFALTPAERTSLEQSRTLGGIASLPLAAKYRIVQLDGQDYVVIFVPNAQAGAFWAAVRKPPALGPWACDSLADLVSNVLRRALIDRLIAAAETAPET